MTQAWSIRVVFFFFWAGSMATEKREAVFSLEKLSGVSVGPFLGPSATPPPLETSLLEKWLGSWGRACGLGL